MPARQRLLLHEAPKLLRLRGKRLRAHRGACWPLVAPADSHAEGVRKRRALREVRRAIDEFAATIDAKSGGSRGKVHGGCRKPRRQICARRSGKSMRVSMAQQAGLGSWLGEEGWSPLFGASWQGRDTRMANSHASPHRRPLRKHRRPEAYAPASFAFTAADGWMTRLTESSAMLCCEYRHRPASHSSLAFHARMYAAPPGASGAKASTRHLCAPRHSLNVAMTWQPTRSIVSRLPRTWCPSTSNHVAAGCTSDELPALVPPSSTIMPSGSTPFCGEMLRIATC